MKSVKVSLSLLLFIVLIISGAIGEGANEKSLIFGKIHIKSSSGKTISIEARIELLEPSSEDAAGNVLFTTYTDNSGLFGFYNIPYGVYDLRILLGKSILIQKYLNDEGEVVQSKTQPIKIERPRVKISEIIASKEIISRDYGQKYYSMIARHSSQCLDVKGLSTKKGARVQQWPCSSGDNQLFTLVPKGNDYYSMVFKHSSQCLDVKGLSTKKGARVQQWPCSSADNQLFTLVPKGNDYYSMVFKHSGQCLDVKGLSTKKGARVQQWPCSSADNQLWRIRQ